ncbi:MAG: PHP domain-containing protein [Promicromonosporaceae bacterium]|nr:PHP domain-containing protein [Promicromonosporaceae bacterium]
MIDLHTHSSASDGTDSPAELVRHAQAAGVTVLGLTDHDTTGGWAEAAIEAELIGIGLVRGAEVSASFGGRSVHLLSYLHDPARPALTLLMNRTREARLARLKQMTYLVSQDYPITWDDVLAQTTTGTTLGRPHIADALVAAGVVPDRDAAFDTIINPRGPYYVRYAATPAADVVGAIIQSGGVPVLAHPFAISRGRGLTDDDVAGLATAGLAGIEVWHREMDESARRRALRLATKLGLLPTGSSDYHGLGKPNRLGEHWTSPEVLGRIVGQGAIGLV